jgi:hypothetical protein
MADAVKSAARTERREIARTRRRRDDIWIGATALVAAMLALPLAQSTWHGPEVASVLAVAATAMLAGQRWAIAIVVLAELLLAPTVVVQGFFSGLSLWPGQIAALVAMMMIVPGILAMRRAAAALVLVTGRQRTREMCRKFHTALVAVGALAVIIPLL